MAYRHAPGCNWLTKPPDYRAVWSTGGVYANGTPTVLMYDPQHGTCLEPCACWQSTHGLGECAAPEETTS